MLVNGLLQKDFMLLLTVLWRNGFVQHCNTGIELQNWLSPEMSRVFASLSLMDVEEYGEDLEKDTFVLTSDFYLAVRRL